MYVLKTTFKLANFCDNIIPSPSHIVKLCRVAPTQLICIIHLHKCNYENYNIMIH